MKSRMQTGRLRLAVGVVLAAGLLAGLVLLRGTQGVMSAHYAVDTAAGRIAYLRALGWTVDPASENVRSQTLPETFDATWQRYNETMRAQGFDLAPYAGQTVTVATYALTDRAAPPGTAIVQLWIHSGVVIGGEIHTTALDGEMRGILPEK